MRRIPALLATILALALALVSGGDTVRAEPDSIAAGHDLFETVSGTDFDSQPTTYQDLSLPAGFFGPGCAAFAGRVALEGVPFDTFSTFSGLSPTDTIVERKATAGPAFPATIPIEIVALSLTSVSPITVTGCSSGGDPQFWDMDAAIPEGDTNQLTGSMTIRHEFPNGGTFDSTLPVRPLLTFTRVGGGSGSPIGPCYFPDPAGGPSSPCGFPEDDTFPVQTFSASGVPWCHTGGTLDFPPGAVLVEVSGLTSNFFAGVICADSGSPPSGQKTKELTREQALLARHGVLPAENQPHPTPTPPGVGGIAERVVEGSDSPASTGGGSGLSTGVYAAIAAGVAAAAVAAAGGWYARRRTR